MSTPKYTCTYMYACTHTGAKDVSTEMKKILIDLQKEGVSGDKIIRLHIKSPNVPCLDLIDMPGLVTSGNAVRHSNGEFVLGACLFRFLGM